jgi:hypothetical protein
LDAVPTQRAVLVKISLKDDGWRSSSDTIEMNIMGGQAHHLSGWGIFGPIFTAIDSFAYQTKDDQAQKERGYNQKNFPNLTQVRTRTFLRTQSFAPLNSLFFYHKENTVKKNNMTGQLRLKKLSCLVLESANEIRERKKTGRSFV